jgi:hypothetical protein
MTKDEAQAAWEIAESNTDLSGVEDDHLHGFGLPGFAPVHTTLEAVALLLRWQGKRFDGSWDMDAVNEVFNCGRYRFIILNGVVS